MQNFSEQVRKVAPYLNLGVMLVACVFMGMALGYWVDGIWNTKPWMLIAGSLLGMGAGFYHFFKTILSLEQAEKRSRKPDDDH